MKNQINEPTSAKDSLGSPTSAKATAGKYLKYAIGEILLVVIGILIALQINNWNSERKDRDKEALLLKQIHRDFKSNKVQLDSIMILNRRMESSLMIFLSTLIQTPDERILDTMSKYGDDISALKTFNASNGAVETLIYSSSFELIKSDTLRNLLVSWKDVYNDYKEEEDYLYTFQTQTLIPFTRKYFDYIDPFSQENLEVIHTTEFRNIWIEKLRNVQMVLTAYKEEQVDLYINEIIRLTSPND